MHPITHISHPLWPYWKLHEVLLEVYALCRCMGALSAHCNGFLMNRTLDSHAMLTTYYCGSISQRQISIQGRGKRSNCPSSFLPELTQPVLVCLLPHLINFNTYSFMVSVTALILFKNPGSPTVSSCVSVSLER